MTKNANTQSLLAALLVVVSLDKLAPPKMTAPVKPEGYQEVRDGLYSMGEHLADPARAESRRTSLDDVGAELIALLQNAVHRGMPFQHLPAYFDYTAQERQYQSTNYAYVQDSTAKAKALAAQVQQWVDDLSAVLSVRAALGRDVVCEAAEAGNRLLIGTALDLAAREKLNRSAAAELPIMPAARGLSVLQNAGISPADLEVADLEALFAEAGAAIYPTGVMGMHCEALDFRTRSSMVRVDHQGAVLYRNARTAGGTSMLPCKVLGAVSKAAEKELQAAIDARLGSVPHQFIDAPAGNGALGQSLSHENGKAMNAFAATLC